QLRGGVESDVGTDHVEGALREVGDVEDAEDQRQAQRHQRVKAAGVQRVEHQLENRVHVSAAAASAVAREHTALGQVVPNLLRDDLAATQLEAVDEPDVGERFAVQVLPVERASDI